MSAVNEKCRQVADLVWDGEPFRVGDRISFRSKVWTSVDSRYVRLTGVVVELWLESWRGVDDLAYAEVDCNGEQERCWFHRDRAVQASELESDLAATAGAAPEGALW